MQAPKVIAFLREDSLTEQVFVINNDSSFPNEKLLFDFSLSVGDTLKNSFTLTHGSGTIDSISQIILNNNDSNRLLYFDYTQYPINDLVTNYMIEGVGGPGGLVNSFFYNGLSGVQEYYEIICYSKNGINLFGNCNYPSYTTEIEEEVSLKIRSYY